MRPAALFLLFLLPTVAFADDLTAKPTFAGTWETDYGPLTLTEKDGTVTGFYVDARRVKCEVTGKVEKGKLTFTYFEPPNTKGEGEFELSADGRGITGKWRVIGTETWGKWSGKRVRAKDFDGVWRSRTGLMRLVQDGDKVRGMYLWNGSSGTIEGTVKGTQLTFTYQEADASGEGVFDLSDNMDTFAGKWKVKGGSAFQEWPPSSRVVPVPGRKWLVVVEANWEGTIAEQEYSFGDMLKAFFARTPQVSVRQRWFTDEASLQKWLKEIAFIPEPVVVSVATHGNPKGVAVGGKTVSAKAIADALRYTPNIQVLHFSACEMMTGTFAADLQKELGADATFPVSGYTTVADWAGSALVEFLYYELILCRGWEPNKALDQVLKLAPVAGEKGEAGQAIRPLGMKLKAPATK